MSQTLTMIVAGIRQIAVQIMMMTQIKVFDKENKSVDTRKSSRHGPKFVKKGTCLWNVLIKTHWIWWKGYLILKMRRAAALNLCKLRYNKPAIVVFQDLYKTCSVYLLL